MSHAAYSLIIWTPTHGPGTVESQFHVHIFPKTIGSHIGLFFHKTEALFNICLSYIYVHVLHSALCIYILYWYKNQNKINRLANQQGHANHLQDIGGDWSRAGLQPVLDLLRDAVKQGAFTPDPLIPLQIEPSPEIFDQMKTQWLQTQSK